MERTDLVPVLGEVVRRLREARGWTRADLAKQTRQLKKVPQYSDDPGIESVSASNIGQIERVYVKKVRVRTLRSIAAAFNVPPSELQPALPPREITRYIDSCTEIFDWGTNFAGRTEEMRAIKTFCQRGEGRGVFLIWGEAGLGKSGILARFVVENDTCVRHFIRRQRAEARPEDCLRNLSAQLIRRFYLPWKSLSRTREGQVRDFQTILNEVSQRLSKDEKVEIVIDGLDELEDPLDSQNPLGIPRRPPAGIFFLLSSRGDEPTIYDGSIHLSRDDPEQQKAIREYIDRRLREPNIENRVANSGLTHRDCATQIEDKCEYNFMYLSTLFSELDTPVDEANEEGDELDLRHLPVGWQNYFKDHWHRLWTRKRGNLAFSRQRLTTLVALARHEWTHKRLAEVVDVDPAALSKLLYRWRMFLRTRTVSGVLHIAFHHRTYQDFLQEHKLMHAALAECDMTWDSAVQYIAERYNAIGPES